MNIFFLYKSARLSAIHQCDKHVVKMILESIQLLYFAHYVLNGKVERDDDIIPYKPSKHHLKHPCTLWVTKSSKNYDWLCKHAYHLSKEYTRRYNKVHGCLKHLDWLTKNNPSPKMTKNTLPAKAVKEEYKVEGDTIESVIESYRKCYKEDKVRFAKWKKGNCPDWWYE